MSSIPPGSRSPAGEAPRRLARAEAVLGGRTRRITVVLEDAHDPHNVSAALRTCEAFGIQDVHLVAEQQSPSILNPAVSIGAHRWLTVHRHHGAEKAIHALRAAGYSLCVSSLDDRSVPLPQVDAGTRPAYVFGNERSGVTGQWLRAADSTFIIPTSGFSGSLNLSVAVALTVYDRLLGQPGADLPAGDLNAEEVAALRAAWYEQLAGANAERRREYATLVAHGVDPRHEPARDRRRPAGPVHPAAGGAESTDTP